MRTREAMPVLWCVLVCAMAIAACLGGPRLLKYFFSQERVPRPMFREWRDHDWGPGWCEIFWIRDWDGTFLWADYALNMIVVRATGDPACTGASNVYGPASSELLVGSRYSLKVDPMPNTLYIVLPSGTASRFNLAEGAARTIYDALKDRDPGTMILKSLSDHYAGDDRDGLKAFLESNGAEEQDEAGPPAGGQDVDRPPDSPTDE